MWSSLIYNQDYLLHKIWLDDIQEQDLKIQIAKNLTTWESTESIILNRGKERSHHSRRIEKRMRLALLRHLLSSWLRHVCCRDGGGMAMAGKPCIRHHHIRSGFGSHIRYLFRARTGSSVMELYLITRQGNCTVQLHLGKLGGKSRDDTKKYQHGLLFESFHSFYSRANLAEVFLKGLMGGRWRLKENWTYALVEKDGRYERDG